MPIVLIIVGLAVVIGAGSFFLRPEEAVTPIPTETAARLETENVPTTSSSTPEDDSDANEATTKTTVNTIYTNGEHNVTTSYLAPNKANHDVAVTLTLTDDVVTDTTITFSGDEVDVSKGYQAKFLATYEAQVIGKKLDDIKLSRVGGASLTSNAFNDAVAKVKAAAIN